MYSKHPSEKLIELFKNKPYQCQDPQNAKVIFLGLDANWDQNIENDGFYKYIEEYLLDGIKFWEKYGVHHPFLLDAYPSGGGVRYHKQFSKLGLSHKHAKYISFVELLDIPTVGNTSKNLNLFYDLLNLEYLKKLDQILLNENKKLLFVSSGVLRTLKKIQKKHGVFDWVPKNDIKGLNKIQEIYNNNYLKVCYSTHFSASISDNHLMEMGNAIDDFINFTY